MKKYLQVLLCIGLGLSALCACAAAATGGKAYGEKDTDIKAKAGELFTIQLEENPTTGYHWFYTIGDESIVAIEKDDYKADKSDRNLVGSGGMRILTFEALKKGETTISLVYARSFEENTDDKKLAYTVTVD